MDSTELKNIRVLRISEVLSPYSAPVLEMLGERIDFTYAYTDKCEVRETTSFKTKKLDCIRIGKAIYIKNLRKLSKNYDVVIFGTHLRILNTILLFFLPHKYKIITWSIGLYINYRIQFNLSKKPDWKDKFTRWVLEKSDACILYTRAPIDYWQKHGGINSSKYFVAHNTVKVSSFEQLPDFNQRKNILFIGTLYAQKGLDELIEAYRIAKSQSDDIPPLLIIGKGPEENAIRTLIDKNGLGSIISLIGPIYDEEKLKSYFFSSFLCVSPKQAGLSVQRSLGYGTPFVTRPDAITGGERFDVIAGETGLYYNSVDELAGIILKANSNKKSIEIMSKKSYDYYMSNATPEIMVQGVIDAIQYTMKGE